jgi:dihydroorotate dehydrogenase (fumarate)
MDLSTKYLGLSLSNPFVTGASPMVDDLDLVKRLEDAGTAAIVMHSLFEEQILREHVGTLQFIEEHSEFNAEAQSYFPEPDEYRLGPEQYLEHLRKIKSSVKVPVIASLNGTTDSGWTSYAKLLEQAGADALELNLYQLATNLWESGEAIEKRMVEVVRSTKAVVTIPVAVKLSPFYTSLPHFVRQLDEIGTDGVVLFNRFYQPDVDVETLEVQPRLRLSESDELLLRLRWLAILSGRLQASLAVSGGVHTPLDAVKAVMTGADCVQVVSAILRHGPQQLRVLRHGLGEWLEQHEYESMSQLKGSMSLASCPDPAAFERANYMRVLQSWPLAIPSEPGH